MNECVTLHLEFNRRNPTGKDTRTRFLDREYLGGVYANVKNCCSPLCAWICQLFSDIWKHLNREPYFISDCLLLWVNFRAFRLEIGYSRYEILGLPNTVCHILFSINQSQCFYCSQATDEEVKAAYRRLALEWHPDRNKSEDCVKKMAVNHFYNAGFQKFECY